MGIRGLRVVVFGACTPLGRRLVEAYLALGAEVVAAARLRTELEALRADLRHHERLWVAEAELTPAARPLLTDFGRDRPVDAVLDVTQEGPAWTHELADRAALLASLARGVLSARARLLLLHGTTPQRALEPLDERFERVQRELAIDGVALIARALECDAVLQTGEALQRVLDLSDPQVELGSPDAREPAREATP